MAIVTLVEHVQQSTSPLRVDRERGVIKNVKLLGWRSSNGRTYSENGVDASMYDGRPVNVNHAKGERSAYDRLGVVRNPVKRKGGVYGDLHLLKSHPLAPAILEAAERMPEAFGMSHTARGRASSRGDVIERVEEVVSCDVVGDPATTRGLHESRYAAPARTVARRPAPTAVVLSGSSGHHPEFAAAVRRRKLVEQVRQRLNNHPPRLSRVFSEMVEAGLMGEPGNAASGIMTPGQPRVSHPEEDTRRELLRGKVEKLLDDASLTVDELIKRLVELLSDPAAAVRSDAEAEMKAQESRRSSPLGRRLSNAVSLAEARSLASRLMRA